MGPERTATARESVLIVDDDESLLPLLRHAVEEGEERIVVTATSAREARDQLLAREFDVVVTDVSMPEEDGISLMRWAREHVPGPTWIVLTGHGTLDAAILALQLGAFDFITKPLTQRTRLQTSLRNAFDQRRLLRERDGLDTALASSNRQLRDHVEQLEEAYDLLSEQADMLRADLHRAGVIQGALLPNRGPQLSGYHVQALYRPSGVVGGDIYDVVRLDEHHVVVLIADAAGHGLAAAMLAVLFRSQLPLVDFETKRARPPAEVLRIANRSLCDRVVAPGLFLTAAVALLDTRSGLLRVASAGHLPLLLRRANGALERIYHTGPALGLYVEAGFSEHELVLAKGDRLLLFTDGLYDRLEGGAEAATEEIARRLGVVSEADAEPESLWRGFGELLPAAESDAAEPAQTDDITLVLLVAEPGSSRLDNGAIPTPTSLLPSPAESRLELLTGSDDSDVMVSILGRGDWSGSAAFYDHCVEMIVPGHRLTLDLALCTHLDSTFLGTIHELTERAERADVELRLQGVMPPVLELFDELGMSVVADHIVSTSLPLPQRMVPLQPSSHDGHARALRTLAAHVSLANLSERNRGEFDPLIQLLRLEVESMKRSPSG